MNGTKNKIDVDSGLFFVHISRHLFFTIKNIVVNWDTWIESRDSFLAPSSSPALANEGLFELTRRPSLTRAVSSAYAETTENLVVVRWESHLYLTTAGFSVVSADDDKMARVNEERRA